jgi:ribonuclease VapC
VSRVVLDSSAVLAAIGREPGAEKVMSLRPVAAMSTVNFAEVHSKLIERGFPSGDAWEAATSFVQEIIPFDSEQAMAAGALVTFTRTLGLSLGDRACLALAQVLGAPVYTSDRDWTKLNTGVSVHLIR